LGTDGAYFSRELFEFLGELALNNNREWFHANKSRYEAVVRDPLLDFIGDFSEPLNGISSHFVADPRPTGGSMFRIYRDVRFSKDKSPYKTMAAAHFSHERSKEVPAPGFYLHLAPAESFVGVGIWHPDSVTLKKIRDAIVSDPDGWRQVIGDAGFSSNYERGGDSLKRPPKGYDPEHPPIEDLKLKDFIASAQLAEEDVYSADFMGRFTESCRASTPFLQFLTKAVGLSW
jgi:uncharacterized protein (TIGR02453 family)